MTTNAKFDFAFILVNSTKIHLNTNINFFLNIKTFISNITKKPKKLINQIKINYKLLNVRNDFYSRCQTKNRMKTVKFQIDQTKTTRTRFHLIKNRTFRIKTSIHFDIVNFWKITISKKKNYRNEYIFNNYNRRERKNYHFDYWQTNRYENREQYQKTYTDEKRFYEKKFSKLYENINFNEKFDDEEFSKFYSYNLHLKSSNVCKKCDKSKKKFRLIMSFTVIFIVFQKKNR